MAEDVVDIKPVDESSDALFLREFRNQTDVAERVHSWQGRIDDPSKYADLGVGAEGGRMRRFSCALTFLGCRLAL